MSSNSNQSNLGPSAHTPTAVPGAHEREAGRPDGPAVGHDGHWDRWREEMQDWAGRSRIVLTPVAAPSILGLFGFAAGTAMVSTWMAGWWGTPDAPLTLWPFAFAAGGIAQLLAGMWCYRARDAVGTAMHGIWGAFWIGFAILAALAETGVAPPLVLGQNVAFGWWFIMLAAITGMGALAAVADNLALFATLAALTVGSVFAAIGYCSLDAGWAFTVAGWVLFGSACAAYYVASSLMLASAFGRTVLPLGEFRKEANIPGRKPSVRSSTRTACRAPRSASKPLRVVWSRVCSGAL